MPDADKQCMSCDLNYSTAPCTCTDWVCVRCGAPTDGPGRLCVQCGPDGTLTQSPRCTGCASFYRACAVCNTLDCPTCHTCVIGPKSLNPAKGCDYCDGRGGVSGTCANCLPPPQTPAKFFASKDWTQSFSGKKITPGALTAESVSIADIAHALSMKCRFNGHVDRFYSVAEHCVLGARLLPPTYALAFLLHEVSEVYLPDVPTPVKIALRVLVPGCSEKTRSFVDLEKEHASVILKAIGHESVLPLLDSKEVHAMDLAMLLAERDQLLKTPPEPWAVTAEPAPMYVNGWMPQQAEDEFALTYARLTSVPR